MLSLEQMRALPEEGSGPSVYFLWKGEDLQYIGAATTNPTHRIHRHWCNLRYRGKSFTDGDRNSFVVPHDRATILSVDREELWRVEQAYQRMYDPPYNDPAPYVRT